MHMPIRWILIIAVVVGAGLSLRSYRLKYSPPRSAVAAPIADQAVANEAADVARAFRSLSSATPATAPADKLWLVDLSNFASNHPGQWIIGRSGKPCLSQAEALQSARADAGNSIDGLLRQQLAKYHGDSAWIGSRIRADIQAGQLQMDCLIEQFTRPYGTIWTGSVLIDAPAEKLSSLITRHADELRAQRARTARMRAAAVLIIAIAWLLYLPLDAITKGYFTTPLRFSAMIVTIAAVVILS
jgi:hypothetical protein